MNEYRVVVVVARVVVVVDLAVVVVGWLVVVVVGVVLVDIVVVVEGGDGTGTVVRLSASNVVGTSEV